MGSGCWRQSFTRPHPGAARVCWVLPGCVSRPPRREHPQKQTDILSGLFWVAARGLHRIANYSHPFTSQTPGVYLWVKPCDSQAPRGAEIAGGLAT